MSKLSTEIKKNFKGDVLEDPKTRDKYSRDASLFEVEPQVVVFPKDVEDVKSLVNLASSGKYPDISLTARAAGTDMTGAAIGEGMVMDFTKYFKREEVNKKEMRAVVEPGVFFRDFEKETLPKHISMPVYPASKSLAALGGMVMNNCGGEKTLRYGQIRNFVKGMKVVLSDGEEYSFKKLNMDELEEKKSQENFEGEVYRKTFDLIDQNYDLIQQAKPKTAKNSSGYALWDVYDREEGEFDLTQLFTGSQGTLGIMTETELELVEVREHKQLVVLFFKDWNELPAVVNALLPFEPESLETFDDTTLKLGLRFMPEIAKKVGKSFFAFAKQFLPEVKIGIKMLGLPKLVVLVEIEEDGRELAEEKARKIVDAVRSLNALNKRRNKVEYRLIDDEDEAEKYWVMRRESFSLLRTKVKGKRTAPFIDDICVVPEKLPEFLPRLLKILKDHGIKINIAGHAGSGNLHIIPLMDLTKKSERDKIPEVSDKVFKLIKEFEGTITAEHNDGIIRTPYVEEMFGSEVYALFEEVKNIFDPKNIFNPGKKVDGTVEYMKEHISAK